MIYTVTWLPSAQTELTRLWLASADRAALAKAANKIDKELRDNADVKGFPFFGDRILRVDPLLVIFSTSPDDCLVEVTQVFLMNP